MLRITRNLVLIACFGISLLALYAPAVQAASPGSAPTASATTLPATHVTVASAQLNAVIETRGQATQWWFQYGATTVHDHSTPVSRIPAGRGTVQVSATIAGLRANTTYSFRVVAASGIGSNYVEVYYAATLTFTTKRWHGTLRLIGSRLPVSGQIVRVRLACSSNYACGGRLSITTRAQGGSGGAVGCAAKSLRVGAHRTRKVRATISASCATLLSNAPNHRLSGMFSSSTTTLQRGQTRRVQLVLSRP